MRRFMGVVLTVAGWAAAVWCGMVGLLATAMSGMKVLESDGRYGLDQLGLSVGGLLLAVLLCCGVIRLGGALLKPKSMEP